MLKEKVQQVLDSFADEVDVDAFLEKVYLLRRIDEAEAQITAGDVISHDDAKRRLDRWLA